MMNYDFEREFAELDARIARDIEQMRIMVAEMEQQMLDDQNNLFLQEQMMMDNQNQIFHQQMLDDQNQLLHQQMMMGIF